MPLEIKSITVKTANGVLSHTFAPDPFDVDTIQTFRFDIDGDTLVDPEDRLISVDFDPNNEPHINGNGVDGTVDYVEIDNLGVDYQVLIETENGFERMLVENSGTGNEGFDISGIILSEFDAGDPVNMDFNLLVRDGDFDTAGGSLDITLTPPDTIL